MTEQEKEEVKPKEQERNKLRCSKCNSSFLYVRMRTHEVCCRKCGHIEEMK